jgi:hypothetical protein
MLLTILLDLNRLKVDVAQGYGSLALFRSHIMIM